MLYAECRHSDAQCGSCESHEDLWRCLDCLGQPTECTSCCARSHRRLPFHRVEQWVGNFFKPAWLRQVGVAIHLGHGGEPCPSFSDSISLDESDEDDGWTDSSDEENNNSHTKDSGETGSKLIVIDKSGVHPIAVRWCHCPNSPPKDIQLLDMQMFPASFRNIKTAFTFQVLDNFLIDNRECKTSAMNYFSKLRRLTCNAFPHTVPVGLLAFYFPFLGLNRSRTDTGS